MLNVVNGAKEAVDKILTDPRVQAVSFVGKPGVIKDVIEVDLPRPRDRRDEELMALRVKVLNALHEIDVI